MKYGLYYYKNTKVLGDDIWAYAESLFYPHIDYLIDNTTIYSFKSTNNEKVATVISAFVEPINHEWAFMPPDNIIPLFVGSYFRSTMWEYIENEMVQKYLRKYAPIGVRSISNMKRFNEMGIEAYFSGCVTLTLPKLNKRAQSKKYICCVDVPGYVEDFIRNSVGEEIEIKRMSHEIWTWSIEEQRIYEKKTISERFDVVKQYLGIYANALCVVTSKLHCALPCLTQETPVLLTLPQDGHGITDMNERMGDFFELFNMCSYEDFNNNSVEYNFESPSPNSDKWRNLKVDIEDRINMFISKCENGEEIYKESVLDNYERLEGLIEILENKIIQLKNVVDEKNRRLFQMTNEFQKSGGVKVILDLQRRLRKYETFNEWENVEYFGDWSNRAKIMSEMIMESCKSLLDLGCGEMHIKKYISSDIYYMGCDYKKRDDNTIVCDLAKGEFPNVKVDTIFMAGVLEYLNNWEAVLDKMTKHSKQILLSYSISELAPIRSELWVNNITEVEIIETISARGFILVESRQATGNSKAYSFMKEIKK